jgi:hypothetical protein
MQLSIMLMVALSAVRPGLGQHDHAAMLRGEQAMGFDQGRTTHHFLLEESGGTILVTARNPRDEESVTGIRRHLERIRTAFASGDFALPLFIHATEPPGVPVLKARRAYLTYRYEDADSGGRLVISTSDREALAALHQFLRFQITEHQTGDPLQPKTAAKIR